MRTFVTIFFVLLVLGGAGYGGWRWYEKQKEAAPVVYKTGKVTRGDLLVTIGATGTVEPEEVVDIGAQVAGQIYAFGLDKSGHTIDYGSVIEEGMVLAEIDKTLFEADVVVAEAQVSQAKAGVVRSQADLEQLKAKLTQAERDWNRAKKLGPSEALAQSAFDAYESAHDSAKANVAVGEATIIQQQASVTQAQASLDRAKRNLGYTTIKSPVQGVIIDRRVNIGQTVVSSLNAPSLFLLAKDLKKMEVWVAVNEADIGQVREGQPVTFTVDAFPGETFKGQVGKVRLNASMTQNVVTYVVEVVTDNSSGRLKPYLTASVQFEVSRKRDVFQVPNAALRYLPPTERIAPGAVAAWNDGDDKALMATTAPATTEPADNAAATQPGEHKRRGHKGDGSTTQPGQPRVEREGETGKGYLWVRDSGNFLRPIPVTTGSTDGLSREVRGEGLTEDMDVVVGEIVTETKESTAETNPFAPKFGGSRRGGGTGGGGKR